MEATHELTNLKQNSTSNKKSIQWTPGSQIYCSNKKVIFGQKMNYEQKKSKQDKYTMDPGQSSLSPQKVKKIGHNDFRTKKDKKMHKSCIIND